MTCSMQGQRSQFANFAMFNIKDLIREFSVLLDTLIDGHAELAKHYRNQAIESSAFGWFCGMMLQTRQYSCRRSCDRFEHTQGSNSSYTTAICDVVRYL